jgi:hypothetical protein
MMHIASNHSPVYTPMQQIENFQQTKSPIPFSLPLLLPPPPARPLPLNIDHAYAHGAIGVGHLLAPLHGGAVHRVTNTSTPRPAHALLRRVLHQHPGGALRQRLVVAQHRCVAVTWEQELMDAVLPPLYFSCGQPAPLEALGHQHLHVVLQRQPLFAVRRCLQRRGESAAPCNHHSQTKRTSFMSLPILLIHSAM